MAPLPGGSIVASEPSPYTHDVFISYSHRDAGWVDGKLLPALEVGELKVLIDKEKFLVGEILLESMEAAVRSSRHTLVVLTPSWFESEWARYEEKLASASDPQRRSRKVIPLLLEKCKLSDHLSLLIYADFTGDRYQEEMEWLLRSLSAKRAEVVARATAALSPVQGEPVRKGLAALCELMQKPQVREAVIACRIYFEEACRQIDILGDYKDQHDLLDTLQNLCYEPIVREVPYFPGDERTRKSLGAYDWTLRKILQQLRAIAARTRSAPGERDRIEMDWIDEHLGPSQKDLGSALESGDAEYLDRSIWHLNRVLSTQPSNVNSRLNDSAKDLRLARLAQTLRALCSGLSGPGLEPEPVRRFEEGATGLAELNQNLAGLVIDHDQWQRVDLELRKIEANLDHPKELDYSWPNLDSKLGALCRDVAEPWAVELDTDRERLTKALQQRGPKQDPVIQELFWRCRRAASLRFSQVDLALKGQCDELRKVAEPLAVVLRMLE